MISRKETGLILEGGATRGIFTSGVLDYLMEQDFYFPYVIGVSAGSCNALGYVSRQIGRTRECILHQGDANPIEGVKRTIRTKSLFNMDQLFDEFPNKVYPFDYETYFNSPIYCEMAATNCRTGQAEYLRETKDKARLMEICRASSSLPVLSPMVSVDGQEYLDGGIADSIPILHSLKTGHKRNVLILTRNKGYRKKPVKKSKGVYMAAYLDYPKLYHSLIRRPVIYNKTISYIEKWEKEGKVFVIRPTVETIARTERNEKKILDFYQHGYDTMKEQFEEMKGFLNH